jgi:EAL domain-containing protein (putative c-di-GMP-specific phosphodiesterase class I)
MLRVCQRDLGMQVVCEGVETAGECSALIAADATLLQGYLFGRPQPGFELPAWLEADSGTFPVRAALLPVVAHCR